MDRPSSSSPQRDVPAPQDDEIEQIASQMEWQNDQSGNEHSDEQSGDEQGRIARDLALGKEMNGSTRLIHTLFRKEKDVQRR